VKGCSFLSFFSLLTALSSHAESSLTAIAGSNCTAGIQKAIDALPPGRTSIRTIKLIGEFAIDQPVRLPDYTRLDLSDARLVLAEGVKASMIVNSDPGKGNHHIEIIGGIIDGNKAGQGEGDFHGILLVRCGFVRVADLDAINCSGDGIRINGAGGHLRYVQLTGLRLMDNNRCGLNVMWAMRSILVSDVTASGNKEVGVRSDHSEGLYQNICANGNEGHGIFIRNIFGGTYNNLTATRNGGMGIHVQGMVASRGGNWGAHNNCTKERGKFADIFFDGDASLSYGMTKQTVLNNIMAGPYKEYGPASEKSGVEFGEGIRDGLHITNLLVLNGEK
jgi:hypothetical protein